jgi:hypothetical protein
MNSADAAASGGSTGGRDYLHDVTIAKGLAIFLVVFGHIVTGPPPQGNEWYNVIRTALYAFHMPFFIYLSGYIFFYTDSPGRARANFGAFVVRRGGTVAGAFSAVWPAHNRGKTRCPALHSCRQCRRECRDRYLQPVLVHGKQRGEIRMVCVRPVRNNHFRDPCPAHRALSPVLDAARAPLELDPHNLDVYSGRTAPHDSGALPRPVCPLRGIFFRRRRRHCPSRKMGCDD